MQVGILNAYNSTGPYTSERNKKIVPQIRSLIYVHFSYKQIFYLI